MKKIRTRYAPSPTGYLHIGGARTALFAYLYAKHFNGDFIVRIEDTDVKRNQEDGERSQLENLKWLGIIPDESPEMPNPKYGKYRQSEKIARYKEIINLLIKEGHAYKAYDNVKELEQQKSEQEAKGIFSFRYDPNWLSISDQEKQKREENGQYTIRLKLPKNKKYAWNDIVRGDIEVNTDDIGDFVILKQDGFPTYNFAVVIDDHDMEISHVLRGEEHITNTPKQLVIYDLLNWNPPVFGHLTIITNMDGKKLSKRDIHLKQFVQDYRNEQFASEAVFNFLALLGWTHESAREIFTREELKKCFDPQRLSKSSSKFDVKKMEWFSKEYIKKMPNEQILTFINFGNEKKERSWIELFLNTYKENAKTFNVIQKNLNMYLFPEEIKVLKKEVVEVFWNKLKDLTFNIENIALAINYTKEQTQKKGKELFMPIRLATTGKEHGPELAKAIFLFGESIIKERLS